jgi:hypothetical protein
MLFTAYICLILALCIAVIVFYMIPDIKGEFRQIRAECEGLKPDRSEIRAALDEIKLAEQQFRYADRHYIDTATYKLQAAISRFNALVQEQKE